MQIANKTKHQLKRILIILGAWRVLGPFWRRFCYKQREKIVRDLMKFYAQFIKPGDLCFDVGANMGEYTEPLLRLGAKVIAIEPQSHCAKFLENKYKGNPNLIVINKGLAEKEGVLEFYACQEADSISTFSEKYKKTSFPGYRWQEGKLMPVTTLDNLIKEFGLPKFCKIDVEGFEERVLRGMNSASLIPYLLVEDSAEEETKKYSDYLFSLGYKLGGRQRNNLFFKYANY